MKREHKGVVLVVDDEAANLSLLFDCLQRANFKVLIAEDGKSALERLERNRPDIVLLDIRLPDVDGFELYARIREIEQLAGLPVIFLSVLSDIAHKVRAFDIDAVDYITKPFEPQEVVARVEKHLELQRLYGWIEEQNAQLQEEATRRANVEAALQRARDELLVLYEVSAVTSQDLPLKTMLDQALSKAMQAIPSEHGAILLPVEKEAESQPDALRLMTQQGTLGEVMPPREALFPGGGLMGWLHQEREPLLIPDLSVEMRVHPAMRQIGSKAMLATPLRAEGRVLGIMGLIRAKDRGFNLEEIALLASVGDQIGVAVQRDRLRQRAWQANVLEERQRLSRNLHDSVTQSLYGLVTLTEAGQEHLEKGALERAGEMFDRLGTVARQALKEMRLFIFELHPPALEEAGLAAALQMRLDAVEGRSGVQARIAGDDVDIHLPQPVEETLYYIAQEALNNILKHAGDCSASISLHAEGEKLVIEIADNGCGFDPQAATAGVGLRNMRERAAEIGAALEVRSAPGEGVRVRVVVEVGELVSAGSERRHVVEGLS